MSNPITAEDKLHVQQFIKGGQEERIFHMADMEAIGVIDGKHDRERRAQEETQRRLREKFQDQQRRIQQQEESLRIQEEEHEAEMAENRKDFRKAVILAGILCGFGGMHLIEAWRPDFAMAVGGVLILCGIATLVISAAALFRK